MTNASGVVADVRLLVNRALAGDQHAMLEIVERYRQRVFGLCYRILGQREDAEDVSQEAFLRVLSNLPRWDQDRAFEPWLMTITVNRCRTQLSRRKRHEPHCRLACAPEDHRWSEESDASLLSEEILLALQTLPPNHREAFSLFHERQLSYPQIASRLGVPEGTVKTWVHRARNALVQRLISRQVLETRHAM